MIRVRSLAFSGLTLVAACAGSAASAAPPGASTAPASGGAAGAAESEPPRYALPNGCSHAGTTFVCEPLTNKGCDMSEREACDLDAHGGFECREPPNYVKEGGDCDAEDGPACVPGLGCDGATETDPSGTCARFCCSDTDCAAGTTCRSHDEAFGTFGFCR